jgi:hypothetical protein
MKRPTLEGYNRVVWAIIGTGALVLAAVTLGTVSTKLIRELSDDDGALRVARVVDGNAAARDAARYDFCQPIVPHGSPFQLIRVASDRLLIHGAAVAQAERPRGSGSWRKFKYGKSSSETCAFEGRDVPSAVVNVLIRNAETGALHRALDENSVIYTLDYPTAAEVDDDRAFPPAGMLFWEIATADTSGDGIIDDKDDVGAYVSDADGRNMKRITPAASRLLSRTYDRQRNTLLLQVLRDTNSDKKLDDEDFPSLVEASVTRRTIVREVIDPETLAQMMREAEPKP